jgi:glycosyltransferase involved in cell wall biosynthesis
VKTVALIPAYNESRTIEAVVAGVVHYVDHVIVVDDGSSDGTGQLAHRGGAEVIRRERNGGKGLAIRAGLERVLEGPFTHVLLLDGDMQHRPDEAARLIETAARADADLVIGERQFRRESMPRNRYWANRIGSRALSAFVGAPVNDTQCGFRVCRLEPLRGIRLRSRGYEIETEMLIKLRRRGATVVGVPISAVYSSAPSKLRPVRDTTKTCFLAVYYRYIERL